jgi:hypothetical protein
MCIQCLCCATCFSRTVQRILKESTPCALGQIALLRHVVVIINFDIAGCFSSYFCNVYYMLINMILSLMLPLCI